MMRFLARIIPMLFILLAPPLAAAQVVDNPCEASIETATTDPKFLYFKSTIANFGLAQVQNLNIQVMPVGGDGVPAQTMNLPKYKAVLVTGVAADAEGKRCYQVPISTGNIVFSAALARDGVTIYRFLTQFDNSNDLLDSDWSEGSNPFVLSAPVVPRPAAPTAVRVK